VGESSIFAAKLRDDETNIHSPPRGRYL